MTMASDRTCTGPFQKAIFATTACVAELPVCIERQSTLPNHLGVPDVFIYARKGGLPK